MNDTKIEWCDMTWNPVTGCLHGCEYCYAKKVAHRFDGKVFDTSPLPGGLHVLEDRPPWPPYPYGFAPTFHRYRLGDPASKTKGKTIFVCSMADLFGSWVPTKWIVDVLDACLAAPQHRYLFLTKNPKRYLELDEMALLPLQAISGTALLSPPRLRIILHGHIHSTHSPALSRCLSRLVIRTATKLGLLDGSLSVLRPGTGRER